MLSLAYEFIIFSKTSIIIYFPSFLFFNLDRIKFWQGKIYSKGKGAYWCM